MNKYEKALKILSNLKTFYNFNEHQLKNIDNAIEIIKELIIEHEHNQMYTNCLACSTITKLELGKTYALCPNCKNILGNLSKGDNNEAK